MYSGQRYARCPSCSRPGIWYAGRERGNGNDRLRGVRALATPRCSSRHSHAGRERNDRVPRGIALARPLAMVAIGRGHRLPPHFPALRSRAARPPTHRSGIVFARRACEREDDNGQLAAGLGVAAAVLLPRCRRVGLRHGVRAGRGREDARTDCASRGHGYAALFRHSHASRERNDPCAARHCPGAVSGNVADWVGTWLATAFPGHCGWIFGVPARAGGMATTGCAPCGHGYAALFQSAFARRPRA